MKKILLLLAVLFTSCNQHVQEFHNYTINSIPEGWIKLPQSEKNLGWLHLKSKSSLSLRVSDDVPQSKIDDETYEQMLIKQYKAITPENELIDIYNDTLFNTQFRIIRMKFQNTKHGIQQLIIFYKRNGVKSYGGTIGFPYSEKEIKEKRFPILIQKIMNEIKFNQKN